MSKVNLHPRHIPSLDKLLGDATAAAVVNQLGHDFSVSLYRDAIADCRARILDGRLVPGSEDGSETETVEDFASEEAAAAHIGATVHQQVTTLRDRMLGHSLKPVYNLTGTVLHTNLGRSPLPQACIDSIVSVSTGASTLEFDIEAGKRGDRDTHVEEWLCRLTGAEAATVVNNNAAAVLLTLNTIALQQSVAVSRGELVEIGGSFRVPAIMKKAGCELFEVGTTNRTHLHDYASAIDEGATAVMKVHTSNYRIEGFTKSVSNSELAELAHQHGRIFINDLGSGALVDLSRFGLPAEPTVRDAIDEGADVVTFSGDKLLGGPQCGLIVGKAEVIAAIRANPMKRALRCDKMTLAALETLLKLYANPDRLASNIPSLRLLSREQDDIKATAESLCQPLAECFGDTIIVETRACQSQVGSGAMPVESLPSYSVVLGPAEASVDASPSVSRLASQLRQLHIPVIGRISKNQLILDVRCLEEKDTAEFVANLQTGSD